MKKFFANTICFLTLVLLLFSCREERNPYPIPICHVDILIRLDGFDMGFGAGRMKTFNYTRGHAGCYGSLQYWNMGFRGGVVVLNMGGGEFLAYDMACPNDHWHGCTVVEFISDGGTRVIPDYFECSCCKTKFNILSGQPMAGSQTRYSMRSYHVTPITGGTQFRVHN